MSNEGKHLVVLCDYGLDDAIATLHLFEEEARFSRIDILAIAGNFPADISLRNLCTLVAMSHLPKNKVRIISTTTVAQPTENLTFVHGADGMGDIFSAAEDETEIIPFDNWIKETSACDILLSLGPLTVTEKILSKIQVGELVLMAGCIDGVPNYKGYEFNHGVNPEAFSAVVQYPHKAVTVDIACPALDISDATLEGDTARVRAMRRYRSLCAANGEVGCYVWDDIALSYLLSPEKFTTVEKTDKHGNRINCLVYTAD